MVNTQREQGHYYLVDVYDMVTLGIADDNSSDENSILVSIIYASPFFWPENSHAISESLTGYLIHNNPLTYLLVISDTNRKFCRNKCVDKYRIHLDILTSSLQSYHTKSIFR